MTRSDPVGECLLQLAHGGSTDEGLTLEHLVHGAAHVVGEEIELRPQIQHVDSVHLDTVPRGSRRTKKRAG